MSIQSVTIVEYVLGHEGVTPADMATHFGVSMRTAARRTAVFATLIQSHTEKRRTSYGA